MEEKNKNEDSIFGKIECIKLESTDLESRLFEALKKYYNYNCFKSETQQKAILEISKRTNDVYVSMPTGMNFYIFMIINILQKVSFYRSW